MVHTATLGKSGRSQLLTALVAVGAAFLASLCCIGPVLFVTLGVGAGLASHFEPLRPLFTIVTLGLLALGLHTVYSQKPATSDEMCALDASCAVPRDRSREEIVLWIATVLAVVVLTFPRWSLLFV
ncbi:MAG: mercuric transporter MerT family protein [Gemmatimonadaceae bacterium]